MTAPQSPTTGALECCPSKIYVGRKTIAVTDLLAEVAQLIYAARPFVMASTANTHGASIGRAFDWESAPAFYQSDMLELAYAATQHPAFAPALEALSRPSPIAEPQDSDAVEEFLHELDDWERAYPLSAFPEPDLKKAADLLKAGGMTLDSISASNMRHVVSRIAPKARAIIAARLEAPIAEDALVEAGRHLLDMIDVQERDITPAPKLETNDDANSRDERDQVFGDAVERFRKALKERGE